MTDPITADLVNAIRYQLRYHPEHTVGMYSDALAAYDAAKDAPDARDAEIEALKAVIGRVQHEWQVDDIDELEVAMYLAGDFRTRMVQSAGKP